MPAVTNERFTMALIIVGRAVGWHTWPTSHCN